MAALILRWAMRRDATPKCRVLLCVAALCLAIGACHHRHAQPWCAGVLDSTRVADTLYVTCRATSP